MSKESRINEEIRVPEVRLVGSDGEQLGVVATKKALAMAMDKGLDLVEVAPGAKPPVCRLMDYGKYRFEQSKREKEAKKKQKIINVKEVKLRPNIEEHDLNTKARNAIKFLQNGDKVKLTIMFRGREITHPEKGRELSLRMIDIVSEYGQMEKNPKVEGRNMITIITPKKND